VLCVQGGAPAADPVLYLNPSGLAACGLDTSSGAGLWTITYTVGAWGCERPANEAGCQARAATQSVTHCAFVSMLA